MKLSRYHPSRWMTQRSAMTDYYFTPRYFLSEVELIFLQEQSKRLGIHLNLLIHHLNQILEKRGLADMPVFTTGDPTGRACCWLVNEEGDNPVMCGKKATHHRKRHSRATVGKDNFFFIHVYYCDEHTEEFDHNPPAKEQAWRDYKARQADAEANDLIQTEYSGFGKLHGDEQRQNVRIATEPPKKKVRQAKKTVLRCTGDLPNGDDCTNTVREDLVKQGPLLHLCAECAEAMGI